MADGWDAFPQAGPAPDPWAAFPSADATPATGDQPARITVRPQDPQAAALNIPEAYQQLVSRGLGGIAQGAQDIGEGAGGLTNPEADRSPRGPIPITARLKAVGDILAGVGKTAGGVIDYTTAPLIAPVRAVASAPLKNVLGIPQEWTEFAAGMAVPIPKTINLPAALTRPSVAERARTPTIGELESAGTMARQTPEVTGTVLAPEARARLADEIANDFARQRVSDRSGQTVNEIVQGFKNRGGAFTVDDLDALRKHISEVQPTRDVTGRVINAPELRAAEIARQRIDQFLPNVPASETLSGNPKAAAAKLEEARGNESAAFSAGAINRKEFVAELRAAAANSGHNIGNTMRQRIADILVNPAARRGYSQAELAMMERIVRGTPLENRLREAGNIFGGGGGAHAFYSGVMTLGAAPAIGYGMRKLSNVMTARNIDKLNEMVRADSPLGRKLGAPIEDWSRISQAAEISPTARNIARLTISSRNLSNNLRDVGINVAPDDLVRALGAESQPSEQ